MDQVTQIREKVDIIALISEHIPLKKAGRNFNALCPFHGEKSPSFVVSPERQIWHCFGCQKGGDVYTFLMEYEHMEFPEALRFLAKRTGVQLTSTSYADTEASAKKERLYRINSLAAEFYHYILMHHSAGKDALSYVQGRGIDERLLTTFKLGFAPSSGKALSRYLLQKKQYDQEDILDAGLAFARGREINDFFRGRLIFPLIDHRDNVLGFSGRLLDEKSGFGGKYINTRDTLIYHKREHFFGINITKEAIRKAKQAIVLEGEFDVMTCFQHGISNVIAVKGTALTEQQVNLLHRYAEKVTMCFDGDAAGQEAIKRSLPVLSKKGLQTTVIIIPSGKDPDEALKTDPIAFKKAVAQDINVYDYLFTQALQKYSPNSSEGKGKIAEEILPMLQDIDNAIVREHYLRKLSTGIQTTYESILKELERWEKQRVIRQEVVVPVSKKARSREETMEEYLLALVMQGQQPVLGLGMWEKINEFHHQVNASDKLLSHLATFLKQNRGGFDQKQFSISIPAELIEAYNTAVLFPLPQFADESKAQQEVEKIVQQLKTLYIKEKMKLLSQQIKQREQEGKEEEVESLKKEYSEITANLKTSS